VHGAFFHEPSFLTQNQRRASFFLFKSIHYCWKTVMHLESDNSKVMAILQDVIDGDLCEQYPTLTSELQRKIADELDRTPGEILKKLEDIRNRII
jgi:hypothetical protein